MAERRASSALMTSQTENDTPIKDPECASPYNLVMMEEMTQDKLLGAIEDRYKADGPYTFVADILVALNPYKWIDMYGTNYKERYNPTAPLCDVPHVYACAQAAAKNLRLLNKNQVCLISGESGAGKTETAKLFMHHLLSYTGAGQQTALERKILESQPLLEAFGNAKTGLNDNSSRFGKYIEVLLEGMDDVVGARVRKYLLEKSRVVRQDEGSQNFHAFYYLVDSTVGPQLGLKGSDAYNYLQSGTERTDSEERFNELVSSLAYLGFEEEEVTTLWAVLAAILKLGQIEFVDNEGSTDDSCRFADESLAKDLADTLDVAVDKLLNGLTTKHIVTAGETFHKPLNTEFSTTNRDTMAQNLYDNLFSWLTDQINSKMSPKDDYDYRSVAVLDIFGFENFASNGFEQLFINTANERLQHYFINHIFTYEINELRSEGIRCPKVEYTNNEKQVELLLGSPGIFEVLDEQTKVPNSTDTTAILKMHTELSSNPSYDNIRSSPVSFKIRHYAGDVEYDVAGMLEKNRNTPSLGIAGLMKSSGNAMIASLFKSSETTEEREKAAVEMKAALKSNNSNFFRKASQVGRFGKKHAKKDEAAKPAKKIPLWKQQNMRGAVKKEEKQERKKFTRVGSEKKRARLDTLGAMFKGSLDDLMAMLNAATPHFVRCIKPNMQKKADCFDTKMTQAQLNYTGVLETTKIRQIGYPLRVTFEDFVERYRDVCIPATQRIPASSCANMAVRILQNADLHGWGQGKTKMFLKYEHVKVLVDILEGKKRAAEEERAVAKAIQDKKDAELAEIEAKRAIEVAKVRAAAEAQPSKVDTGLSWQEEMALAKEKKAAAAAKAAKEKEAADKAAAGEEPEKKIDVGGGASAARNMFKTMERGGGKPKADAPQYSNSPTPAKKFCGECGALAGSGKFCQECGSKL